MRTFYEDQKRNMPTEFLRGCDVSGADVFIGRVQVEPAPMHNIDFLIQDLDSGAQWLRAAATENYDYQMGMRQVSLFATDEACYISYFLLSWCTSIKR